MLRRPTTPRSSWRSRYACSTARSAPAPTCSATISPSPTSMWPVFCPGRGRPRSTCRPSRKPPSGSKTAPSGRLRVPHGSCGGSSRRLCSDFWPVDKKGCVLAPLGAGACKDDHVVGDDPDMDQLLDASGAQRGPGHLPEAAAIIAEQPDPNQQSRYDPDGAAQIARVEARPRQRQGDPIDVSVLRIPGKAAIDRFRGVGVTDRTAPIVQHLVVRASKDDVRLAAPVFVEASRG